MPAVTNVLLNLSLLPTRGGITELSIEEVMADHGTKFGIDLTHFTGLDPINGGLHVVVDASPGDSAPSHKGMVVGIEQHLVRLKEISP